MNNYISTVFISLAIIASCWIGGNAYKYKFKTNETISVTGLAEKEFVSDEIVWTGSYSRQTMDLKSAYVQLKQDESRIRTYLKEKGISDDELVFSSVSISKEQHNKYNAEGQIIGTEFAGYLLSQNVTVDSKDIDKIEKVSREVTELIETGIEFNSLPPSYYYTKLSELKVDLLAKASADARQRAETIAKNSGSGLGKIKKATMGVFQITGLNSNEDFSYGGSFNTSSRNKKAAITLKSDYSLD